jgi:hypothetical protein
MSINETVAKIEARVYIQTRVPWGGDTITIATGQSYDGPKDAYACATNNTMSIPEDAEFDVFAEAFETALYRFMGKATYLGIFHDDDKGTIDFDAVEVVNSKEEVDALNVIRPVKGGAYHFLTGNGYWPKG